MTSSVPEPAQFRPLTASRLDRIPQLARIPREAREQMRAVAAVLPFRVNSYVVDHLIDWDRVPDDPIFQLTFPQPGMLSAEDRAEVLSLQRRGASRDELQAVVRTIQRRLNPHPAGQLSLNVPRLDGERLDGVQHKYRETVLLFPSHGQTCHAYCTYCFRWAQFVGLRDLKLAGEPGRMARYVRSQPEVTSVLLTGGDPLVMKTDVLRRYVEPLLDIEHVQTIRLGTKSVAYWPARFVTDADADDLLRLFEEVRARGKQLAVMGHYSHPRELEPDVARAALRRIQDAGAVVRTQSPIIRYVNDHPDVWRDLWKAQVRLGAVPYYMFVARDTGARGYFEVPLARALEVYEGAYRRVSGLARTARGPSMSCGPGKVMIDGVAEVGGERVFVLKLVQARDPAWVNRPFFARFDPGAAWIDQLTPALGARRWFWQPPASEPPRARA